MGRLLHLRHPRVEERVQPGDLRPPWAGGLATRSAALRITDGAVLLGAVDAGLTAIRESLLARIGDS